MSERKQAMKSIELFAGAGGLGLGLHRAGFEPVKVVEWDHDCCETIRANQVSGIANIRTWPLVEGDIRAVDFESYEGKIDLISGGPPCQPFSLGGKHGVYDDARDMFPQAIRAVRQAQPKAFIFENVKGLTREAFRNYFEYIRLQMEHPELVARKSEDWADHLVRLERHHTGGKRDGLHYQVVTRVLNAADYGVPQKRERVIFVGFRDDLGIEWGFPEETHSLEALLWEQVQSGDYWERHKVAKKARVVSARMTGRSERMDERPTTLPWLTVRDALHDLPDPERQPTASTKHSNHRFQPGAKSYPGHTGSPLDEPAKTLKAGVHGVPGGENMLLRPDGTVRYFTVRESARLQTFPDDYCFTSSWTEAMRQIGNAVPVTLANLIGNNVADKLEKINHAPR
jgi:DNA (cytosine-5)-methyltransferase 1